jgi:hypothetical protein
MVMVCSLLSCSGGKAITHSSASVSPEVLSSKNIERKDRLTTLLELRRVYRDIIHASSVLEAPSPVYQPEPPAPSKVDEQTAEVYLANDSSATAASTSEEDDKKERELLEQQRRDKALAIVADMQLTSDNLKVKHAHG